MDMSWMDDLARIHGVVSIMLVDKDGLVVAQAGRASDRIAPHTALMCQNGCPLKLPYKGDRP